MKNIYIRRTHESGDGWWSFLCIVMDNESLGFLERLLQAAGIEFKVEERP